jgi:hypothetical protein
LLPHAGAGADAIINESCQFKLVTSVDTVTIKLVHCGKEIGSQHISVTGAHHQKVVAEAQLVDMRGYGVGTVEYELEITGGGFSVRFQLYAVLITFL